MIHRFLRAALVCLPLGLATSVTAEVPASSVATLDSGYAAIDALARKTRLKGTLPRLVNPDEGAALARVWDAPSILGTPPYSATDVPLLLDIMDKQNRLFKSYVVFTATPGTVPDTARNAFVFQDEITRSQQFLLRTVGAIIPAMTDFVARLPQGQMTEVRRAGLRQARLGWLELVSGAALMLRSPGYRPENQVVLVDALAETAPMLASAASPDDRAALAATAGTAMPNLAPPTKERLQGFLAAMARKACKDLCAVE